MRKMILSGGLVFALLFGIVGFAAADIVSYSAPADGTVTVNCTANSAMSLTLNTPDAAQTVQFGAQDPMSGATANVGVNVKSNVEWDLTKVETDATGMLSTDLLDVVAGAVGDHSLTDVYTLNIPWAAAPGAHTATVQYSVVAN